MNNYHAYSNLISSLDYFSCTIIDDYINDYEAFPDIYKY